MDLPHYSDLLKALIFVEWAVLRLSSRIQKESFSRPIKKRKKHNYLGRFVAKDTGKFQLLLNLRTTRKHWSLCEVNFCNPMS